jgi:hypothetical protein
MRLVLAFAITMLAASAASASSWEVLRKTSAMDGSETYFAALGSDGKILNTLDSEDQAFLSARCEAKETSINIQWPDFFRKADITDDNIRVTWKFDDGPIQKSFWSADLKVAGPHGKEAVNFYASLANAKRLIVKIPDDHGDQEVVFSLDGISEVQAEFSKMGCRVT